MQSMKENYFGPLKTENRVVVLKHDTTLYQIIKLTGMIAFDKTKELKMRNAIARSILINQDLSQLSNYEHRN